MFYLVRCILFIIYGQILQQLTGMSMRSLVRYMAVGRLAKEVSSFRNNQRFISIVFIIIFDFGELAARRIRGRPAPDYCIHAQRQHGHSSKERQSTFPRFKP